MRRPTEGTLSIKSRFCTQTQITSESLIDLSSAPQVTIVNWSISVQTRGESWQRPARNVAVKPKWACRIFEIHRWREGWVHVSQRGRFLPFPTSHEVYLSVIIIEAHLFSWGINSCLIFLIPCRMISGRKSIATTTNKPQFVWSESASTQTKKNDLYEGIPDPGVH